MGDYLDYIAVAISVLALFIATGSLMIARRSHHIRKVFHDYESVPELQILDEHILPVNPLTEGNIAISYRGKINNRGKKAIKIDSINLDYGNESNPSQRMKFFIEGQMLLSPHHMHQFVKEITWQEVEEMKKKYDFNNSSFFLRITYVTQDGEIKDSIHALYGFDGLRTMFQFQKEENT